MRRSPVTTASSTAAMARPGKRSSSRHWDSIQAVTTANAGLTNSEGCSEKPPMRTQRVAPLTSWPTSRVATIRTRAETSMTTAVRRTQSGFIMETRNITPMASTRNTNWRSAK